MLLTEGPHPQRIENILTTLTIESDGMFKANTVIIADNLTADNEERLQAVEEFIDNLEKYITEHTHEISETGAYSTDRIN